MPAVRISQRATIELTYRRTKAVVWELELQVEVTFQE
jgi:hypothetical protein